jgi:hypothetical protein
MSFQAYLDQFQHILTALLATGEAQIIEFQVDAPSGTKGYIRGALLFTDGSECHFREFIDTTKNEPRLMYAYHYQDADKELLFRYDNAAHRPALAQLEHKHTPDGVIPSAPPTFEEILDEIAVSRE